ncbi:MAG: crossover junction endodeoxyribonuclease RuvC [Candidatus Portnoybacteria bacterium]|nr:crossover junction endodeoxyribonuclease RuvC [Candidatus Portnoybacteria bacterium]
MIVLGIDPGTASMGYGIIDVKKSELKLVSFGCINTTKDTPTPDRLKILYKKISELIKKCRPDILSIEQIFFFKNSKTVISVAQARGIAILAAANSGLPVQEYTPLQVKQAVVGYGLAQKQQVQKMVKTILKLKEIPQPDDAADALAIAICAGHCPAAIDSLKIKK